MDYEKKYKEALERAKEKYTKCYSPTLLDYIFPELKSEDVEIRKSIIRSLKLYIKCIKDGYDAPSAKDFVVKDIKKQIDLLEKQGDKPQGKSILEAIKEEKVDNQNCVKSIYNVKPKFKVGDWISNDMCDAHIASIEDGMYYFDEGDGLSIVFVDEHYHLWTIEDAMDGDVLVSRSPFIYGKQCPYGGLNWCNNKFIKASNFIFTDSPVHPATKEQRDFLFQKMKKAGYTFDFEKKELKKLGQPEVTKTSDQEEMAEIPFGVKDSELQEATYFIPKGFHAEIDDDKVVIKKGEKPAAWSEENGRRIQRISDFIWKNRKGDTDDIYQQEQDVKWLKSLKDRVGYEANCTTTKEWSEEDEHRVKDTIYFLDTAKKHYASTVELDACIDWLKSLKQRIGG